jgi:uncharacterized protein (DUF1015 family)
MPIVKPFKAIRPKIELASSIAALPYDVYSRTEAKDAVTKNPLSFLQIDRPETFFPDDYDMYAKEVYIKAKDRLHEMMAEGSFIKREQSCYYIYALTMNERTQTGLVGCVSIDDFLNDRVKKHENIRDDKKIDRTCHIDTCNAQTGPIFMAYRPVDELDRILSEEKTKDPLYDFVAEDNVHHQVWEVSDEEIIKKIAGLFSDINSFYIADGHHRATSAVDVGLKRREENPNYTGEEPFNYFLSVLFPSDELYIYDYNRVVRDLYGHDPEDIMSLLEEKFEIGRPESIPYHPEKKGEFGMYMRGNWYPLIVNPKYIPDNIVDSLDAALLQHLVLEPILGIKNVRTDKRIRYVGGIRGLERLKYLANKTRGIAFALYPPTMDELFEVADEGCLMPPKSTWFEPKLRSGLFIHEM